MLTTIASAPGKVVLSGEYAVLDGAPAVAMAVNRRARVSVQSGGSGGEPPDDPGGLIKLIGAALGKQDDHVGDCDTAAFYDAHSGKKLGLGSSAALTVALCAALRRNTEVLADALQLHRAWQGGAGSGVDIACAAAGGLVEYQQRDATIRRLDWPEGLQYRLIWTGQPANTRNKLSRLNAAGRADSRERLGHASQTVAEAWRTANVSDLLDTLRQYLRELQAFDTDFELGIFAAGHDDLFSSGRDHGLVYKPCGAGGGDIGIALATSAEQLDAYAAANQLHVLDCELDLRGVHLENHAHE